MMSKINTFYRRVFNGFSVCVLLCGVLLFLIACGKEEPETEPVTIKVKIFSIDKEFNANPFIDVATSYDLLDENITVIPESVNLTYENFESRLSQILRDADVIVFPSIAHDVLHTVPDAYYPISSVLSADTMPIGLRSAYAKQNDESLWAVPLMLDPLVMIAKRDVSRYLGSGQAPKDWGNLSGLSNWYLANNHSLPHFLFLNYGPYALTDSFMARVFSLGYERFALQETPQPHPQNFSTELRGLRTAMQAFKRFMVSNPEESIIEIPKVETFEAFLNSNAFFTFCRRSTLAGLSERDLNEIYAFAIPYSRSEITFTPTIAVSAAIPLESSNPAISEQFVSYLSKQMETIAHQVNYLPTNGYSIKDPLLHKPLPENSIFVVRENKKNLSEKNLLDFFNQKADFKDLEEYWRKIFHIPEPSSNE